MSYTRKSFLKRFAVGFLVALLIGYLYLSSRVSGIEDFRKLLPMEQYRLLCDAFTIPGMLFILSGCLIALGNAGALDALGYMAHYLAVTFLPGQKGKVESYYDYVQEKREKNTKGYAFLFAVGGIFMAIAVVFLALFYSV